MDERLQKLGTSVKLYRLVKDRDIVPKVPPSFLSFQHLVPPVWIDDDGTILAKEPAVNDTDGDVESSELREMKFTPPEDEGVSGDGSAKTKYEKWISRVPKGLRDHMPELYVR